MIFKFFLILFFDLLYTIERSKAYYPEEDYPRNIRWKLPIPYVIGCSEFRTQINEAIKYIQNETCITFIEKNENEYMGARFLVFIKSNHSTKQYFHELVSLSERCYQRGGCIVKHIVQALGMISPHQRPDRDSFVDIYAGNITATQRHYFDKVKERNYYIYGKYYDYGSITHYPSTWKSKNKKLTISSRDGMHLYNKVMGYKNYLTFNDKKTLDLYFCRDEIQNHIKRCKIGGYINPKNSTECICPKGFSGSTYCANMSEEEGWQKRKIFLNKTQTYITLKERSFDYMYYIEGPENRVLRVSVTNIVVPLNITCRENHSIELYFRKDKTAGPLILCSNYTYGFAFTTSTNKMWIRYHGKKHKLSFDMYIDLAYRKSNS
uniref:Metalloendopeptidase n=1 Tax=Parastrongyloides trichosuri TaxID=131310 RepID=A0A0N4Z8U1_PARTI